MREEIKGGASSLDKLFKRVSEHMIVDVESGELSSADVFPGEQPDISPESNLQRTEKPLTTVTTSVVGEKEDVTAVFSTLGPRGPGLLAHSEWLHDFPDIPPVLTDLARDHADMVFRHQMIWMLDIVNDITGEPPEESEIAMACMLAKSIQSLGGYEDCFYQNYNEVKQFLQDNGQSLLG